MAANIFDVVTASDAPYKTLVEAVVFAGLTDAVKDKDLMVFAPTEDVFTTTPDYYKWNKEFTEDLLLNHVTEKVNLPTGSEIELKTAGGKTLKASDSKITKNNGIDANIEIASKDSTGFVYDVKGFVIPASQTNVDTLAVNLFDAAAPRLQKVGLDGSVGEDLKDALQKLRDVNVNPKPKFDANYGYTVFLPTEAAFKRLSDEVKEKKGFGQYLADGGLDDTLLAHTRVGGQKVVSGTYESENTKTSYKEIVVDTNAADKTVNIGGVNAKIVNPEPVIYKNGAVHEIEEVLYFPRNTTVEIASETAKTLFSLLEATELDDTLNGLDRSTVFAPTDAALEPVLCYNNWLKITDVDLKKLLTHHVLTDRVYYDAVENVQSGTVATSVAGDDIAKEDLVLDNDQLDVLATNGNIHVINKVLVPSTLKTVLPTGTIVDVASKETPTLAELVVAADLDGALSSCPTTGKAYTVFAPNDDAFNALSTADLEYLQANNNEMLKKVLLHHVVSAPAFADNLKAQQEFTTLNGDKVEVTKSEAGVSVGGAGATVQSPDNKAFNGVIHIIDKVLIPEDVVLPSSNSASMPTVSLISSALVGAASYFLAAF